MQGGTTISSRYFNESAFGDGFSVIFNCVPGQGGR